MVVLSIFGVVTGGAPLNILTEAVNYKDMFAEFFPRGADAEVVNAVIADARKALKKNDRVVWFLRYYRLGLLAAMEETEPASPGAPVRNFPPEMVKRQIDDYAKKSGLTAAEVLAGASYLYNHPNFFLRDIAHFLSLPIPAIQNHVFKMELPKELLRDFETVEKQWQQEAKKAVPHEEGFSFVIKFPDGWAWVNLNRGSCDREGAAMGHCGNVPSERRGQTVLSLREPIKRGDKTLWKPHATFILEPDGYLGEMKGRNNRKPGPELHDKIVALLKNPMIEGIRGGGYMPGENFSLMDLPEPIRDKLFNMKPNLGTLDDFYRVYGIKDERTMERLQNALYDNGIQPYDLDLDKDGERFIIRTWGSFEEFVRDVDDDRVQDLLNLLDDEDVDVDVTDLPEEMVVEMLKRLSDAEQTKVLRLLGLEPVPSNSPRHHRLMVEAAAELRRSEYWDDVLNAADKASVMTRELKKTITDRIIEYIDVGYEFTCSCTWADFDAAQAGNFESPIRQYVSVTDIVDIAMADRDDESTASYYLHDLLSAEGDWSALNSEYLWDQRREAGLVGKDVNRWDRHKSKDKIVRQIEKRGLGLDVYQLGREFVRLVFEW